MKLKMLKHHGPGYFLGKPELDISINHKWNIYITNNKKIIDVCGNMQNAADSEFVNNVSLT